MRDIRSPKPSGSKKFPLPPGEENGSSKELYEISNSQKTAKSDNRAFTKSTPKKTVSNESGSSEFSKPAPQKTPPKKQAVAFEPKPVENKTKPLEVPKTKKSAPIKMTGSKVPVTNLHVPSEDLETHSDADHAHKKPERPLFAKTPVTSKPVKNKTKIGHKERKIVVGLVLLVIAAIFLAAFIFLPKAEVELVLRNAPLLVDEKITIRAQDTTAPDVVSGTAFFREVRIEGETPVTSTELVGTKASGTVRVVNRTTQEQRIKEQSRLVTDDGKLFYMQGPAIVPAASENSPSSVSVEIVAAEDGPDGNIGPQRLNFAALDSSAQSVIYGQVTTTLTGGTGEQVPVIKEEDIQRAQKEAQEAAKQQAEDEIRQEIPQDWLIMEESWDAELASFETNPEAGTQVDKLTYTANVTVHVMGFEEKKLEETLKASLESNLDENYMLFPAPISFTKSMESVDWEKAEAVINARVTHTTVPQLSIETLREKLAGRTKAEAVTYLEGLPGVSNVTMELSPFWVSSVPRIEKRVQIEILPERKP